MWEIKIYLSATDRKMELEINTNSVIQRCESTLTHQPSSRGVVLDAVKIEANGQVIADFGNSEVVNCRCISPTRTPTSGNLRTGIATTLAPMLC